MHQCPQQHCSDTIFRDAFTKGQHHQYQNVCIRIQTAVKQLALEKVPYTAPF